MEDDVLKASEAVADTLNPTTEEVKVQADPGEANICDSCA